MVIGMVLMMSIYGLGAAYLNHAVDPDSILSQYLSTVFRNLILAYPLQILIMGPFIRFLFIRTVKVRVGGQIFTPAE